jgi:hypothetical protein
LKTRNVTGIDSLNLKNYSQNINSVGLFTLLLIVVVVLAVIGIGWETFSVGVINGFEKLIDVGTPFVKDLTQGAKDIVNDPTLLWTN